MRISVNPEYFDLIPYTPEEYRSTSKFEQIQGMTITAVVYKETLSAIHLIIKHFPEVLIQSGNSIYVKDRNKHLLVTNDLLIVDYYLTLLNEYDERVNKYQQYLKRQQDRQRNKLLFVLFLPFILFVLMILVGD